MPKKEHSSKIAIIGAGFVGSTAAYACLIDGAASEIALIDVSKEKAEGEAMDLQHGIPFKQNAKITYGNDYSLCKDAVVVVICAGAHQNKGETRLQLVERNAEIFKKMVPGITKHNKDCILLVVSNPLDILTYLTLKYSKFPKHKVIGSGTILDTARFRYLLGNKFGVSPWKRPCLYFGRTWRFFIPCMGQRQHSRSAFKQIQKYNKKGYG